MILYLIALALGSLAGCGAEEPLPLEVETAIAELDSFAALQEAEALAICTEIAEINDLADYGTSFGEVCGAVAVYIRDVVSRLYPPGFVNTVAGGPVRCRVDLASVQACVAGCDSGAALHTACEGLLVGECEGDCSGECIGDCGGFCGGECSNDCIGTCDGVCNGECDRPCSALDAYDRCIGTCEGECVGRCGGRCDGQCRRGACTQACDSLCDGECTGDCSIDWSPGCHGSVSVTADPRCVAACNLSGLFEAPCSEAQFAVRGPEIVDGDDHLVVDGMVFSVWSRWPRMQTILVRHDELLVPVMEALAAALPADHSAGARLDRAHDRLGEMHGAIADIANAATQR